MKSFFDFIKLNKTEQGKLLIERGIFLDMDNEKDTITRLYFLDGFFVEEIICKNNSEVVELIPFKQGYKIESFLGGRKDLGGKALGTQMKFQWCVN